MRNRHAGKRPVTPAGKLRAELDRLRDKFEIPKVVGHYRDACVAVQWLADEVERRIKPTRTKVVVVAKTE